MKVLVLGGTGAMGVPLVNFLADRGNEVYITTRKSQVMSENRKIHFIHGNAQDINFISGLLKQRFEVIIDFMIYSSKAFGERMESFLTSTEQYIFLSSARVYANTNEQPLTEGSLRLLDTIQDTAYLETDEYALAKAREEDLLMKSAHRNWTIIRPYITYNTRRLQLGVLEKESWLQRALEGKKIVFSRDIAQHYTTLTYGEDVAFRIADLVGSGTALGEIFHIAGNPVSWEQVLDIYLEVLEEKSGKRPEVCWLDDSKRIAWACGNDYQIKYDRFYDRIFDSTKINEFTHKKDYVEISEGLRKCLSEFLDGERVFEGRNWKLEGIFDRISGDHTNIQKIPGWKNKIKYLAGYSISNIF